MNQAWARCRVNRFARCIVRDVLSSLYGARAVEINWKDAKSNLQTVVSQVRQRAEEIKALDKLSETNNEEALWSSSLSDDPDVAQMQQQSAAIINFEQLFKSAYEQSLEATPNSISTACKILENIDTNDHRLLITTAFDWLMLLAFSFSDELRFNAIKLLLCIRDRGAQPLPRLVIAESSALYSAIADAQHWLDALGSITFPSYLREVNRQEAQALLHLSSSYHFRGVFDAKNDDDDLKNLKSWMQDIIDSKLSGKCFVKFTRSTKDAAFAHPDYEAAHAVELQKWEQTYGPPDGPGSHSAIEHLAARSGLCARSADEVVAMLVQSKRVTWDITETLDLCEDTTDIFVVLRQWRPETLIDRELRGFIRARKLTALAQTFSTCYFPWVTPADWLLMMQQARQFFEQEVLERLPLDDCVLDFVMLPDRAFVIEVNAYGGVLANALFNWEQDQQQLYHGPLTGRYIADAMLTIKSIDLC